MNPQFDNQFIVRRLNGVEFSFFQPSQVRNTSALQIFSPLAYDKNKNTLPHGLYDPAMGLLPNDRFSKCLTCKQNGQSCQGIVKVIGHFGHIELFLPVYNPLLIEQLYKLLKVVCLNCQHLRIVRNQYAFLIRVKNCTNVLRLLQLGYTIQALQLKNLGQKMSTKEKEKEKEKGKLKKDEGNIEQQEERDISQLRKRKLQKLANSALKKGQLIQQSNCNIKIIEEIVKVLFSKSQQKCPFCGKLKKKIIKEGFSKFFCQPMQYFIISYQKAKQSDQLSSTKSQKQSKSKQDIEKESKQSKPKYLNPKVVYKHIRKLFKVQHQIMDLLYGNYRRTGTGVHLYSNSYRMFFITVLAVPPNRFRPQNKLGQQKYVHEHTLRLTKIIATNIEIRNEIMMYSNQTKLSKEEKKNLFNQLKNVSFYEVKNNKKFKDKISDAIKFVDVINKWIQLQDLVNASIDSVKAIKISQKETKGIRQLLQKKQGLFRMKMMGKRVNYAARSVISPDPNLETNEVGLPVFMAKKLTFPQNVNQHNSKLLRQLIINGANKYPGANMISENGKMIKLDYLKDYQRQSISKNLLINASNKVVYRHLLNGDTVLFNRQPTLHKPSIMTHKVRVLPKQQTLRMHYANCKSYNGDFDGDQMNIHALQTYTACAQANLNITDKMFVVPSNGRPIRELIQDSVVGAVYLSSRDCFFSEQKFKQLIYSSCENLFSGRIRNSRLQIVEPCILKPKKLWTGKQIITNIIKLVTQTENRKIQKNSTQGLNIKAPIKIPKHVFFGDACNQNQIIIKNNQLISGWIDKNQIGSGAQYGLMHSFFQIYGAKLTGKLFTCLAKVLTQYLKFRGFTCGLQDLVLKKQAQQQRRLGIQRLHSQGVQNIGKYLEVENVKQDKVNYFNRSTYEFNNKNRIDINPIRYHPGIHFLTQNHPILKKLQTTLVNNPATIVQVDLEYKQFSASQSEKIQKNSLKNFLKRFPFNNFSSMALSGAKGSVLNHSQISVMLGQQDIQGKRIPVMPNGASLPSFINFSPNPRHGGFIGDNFLSGLRAQQFYFHCMAGREGLIDTAIKTSRSGYLQRCLVKHLQNLKVEYDMTVRDADGGICQFFYGQDGIDVGEGKWLNKVKFFDQNKQLIMKRYNLQNLQSLQRAKKVEDKQTVMNIYPPSQYLGSISTKALQELKHYTKNQSKQKQKTSSLETIYFTKVMRSLVHPGQAVGITAAQAIGEPSTQMTLNTFHLAGHGGVNLTLGIPRLRQILMTSNDKIKTPIMQLFVNKGEQKNINYICRELQKINLSQFVKNIEVKQSKLICENQKLLPIAQRSRIYSISIQFFQFPMIQSMFGIKKRQILNKLNQKTVKDLLSYINKLQKKQTGLISATINKIKKDIDQTRENDDKFDQEDLLHNQKQDQQKKEENQGQFKFHIKKSIASCEVRVPLSLKKILMTDIISKLLGTSTVRQTPGISKVMILEKKGQLFLQTQGCNLGAVVSKPFLDFRRISTNDIKAIYNFLGVDFIQQVQAARNSIIKQIIRVFQGYGVSVDYRHLYLIADYMTHNATIKVMSRNFMNQNISPFLKMSFQTSIKFLTSAAYQRQFDGCKSASSQIVMGRVPNLGTGCFDILMKS